MFIVAPCYRPPKAHKLGQARPRPKLACPPIEGDLLIDARALYHSGNIIAAAMTCRVELERQLTTLALKHPKFGDAWMGISTTADWLRRRKILRENTYEAVMGAADVGNRAAHGTPVTKTEVMHMFGAVESLRSTVLREGGAV
jgi:hypothetical protein